MTRKTKEKSFDEGRTEVRATQESGTGAVAFRITAIKGKKYVDR
jgi:hypothetical protein